MQIWPELAKTAIAATGMARSRSASRHRITGDLPPSSSETRLMLPPAARAIARPVSVEPVKAMRSIPGWAASAAPASAPSPVTTFSTPSGRPHSCMIRASFSTVSDASSEGFSTTVQPVARAGAIFQTEPAIGAFQGMIAPTTPSGSRTVIETISPGKEFAMVWPWIATACPA